MLCAIMHKSQDAIATVFCLRQLQCHSESKIQVLYTITTDDDDDCDDINSVCSSLREKLDLYIKILFFSSALRTRTTADNVGLL